jgi:hypothetical protein
MSSTALLLPDDLRVVAELPRRHRLAFARHGRGDAEHRAERAAAHLGDDLAAVLGERRDRLVERALLQLLDELLVRLDALGGRPVVPPADQKCDSALLVRNTTRRLRRFAVACTAAPARRHSPWSAISTTGMLTTGTSAAGSMYCSGTNVP